MKISTIPAFESVRIWEVPICVMNLFIFPSIFLEWNFFILMYFFYQGYPPWTLCELAKPIEWRFETFILLVKHSRANIHYMIYSIFKLQQCRWWLYIWNETVSITIYVKLVLSPSIIKLCKVILREMKLSYSHLRVPNCNIAYFPSTLNKTMSICRIQEIKLRLFAGCTKENCAY